MLLTRHISSEKIRKAHESVIDVKWQIEDMWRVSFDIFVFSYALAAKSNAGVRYAETWGVDYVTIITLRSQNPGSPYNERRLQGVLI